MAASYISYLSCVIGMAVIPHQYAFASSAMSKPKMLGEPASPDKALGPKPSTRTLSTSSTTFLGDCHPDKPFEFPLSGTSGRGVIGIEGADNSISASYAKGGSDLVTAAPEPNFFSLESQDSSNFFGWPISYESAETDDIVLVECEEPTPIIVVVDDDSKFSMNATIEEGASGKTLTLSDGMSSNKPLRGQGRGREGGNMFANNPVEFANANDRSIEVRHEKGNPSMGIAIIQAEVTNSDGKSVIRSFVVESKAGSEEIQKPINVR